ncbi:DUF177 domain-containing protein [Synechococcus sp. PCC 7336]|uniref:YceD family protein n=1 Tax=Synechococcus sp. PCC 7336 TaxID=195250 RepID=UPI00034DF4F0|nr:YceD family protein [Synechococcus sp. PCC 7336]
MLRPISLGDLSQVSGGRREIEFRQPIANFVSLTPVQGWVKIVHRGTFVEVAGSFQTIVTLSCHRCLQTYNHQLQAEMSEVLWLEKAPAAIAKEAEVGMEDLLETLSPDGEFDLEDWVYQQLCLSLPQRQLCAEDCAGLVAEVKQGETVDRRWTALQQLKQQFQ